MLKKTLLAASLAAISTSALADHGSHYYSPDMATKMKHYESVSSVKNTHDQGSSDFSYNFFDIGYGFLDSDGADAEVLELNLSSVLNEHYHLRASLNVSGDDETYRISTASVGAGLHTAIDDKKDFFAEFLVGQGDIETSFGDTDISTISATIGVRGKITCDSEYKVTLTHNYIDLDNSSDTENTLGVEYQKHISEKANLFLNAEVSEDTNVLGGGVRFYF